MHSKVENVVMNGSQVGKFGRLLNSKGIVMNGVREKGDMVKSVVMNEVKSGKCGKLRK